ncbi:MAG TPA: FKBP-type peptidyl-prolyl cis-trans isomerase [Thiobacillaceae bacterium]|nr:FKBP-type peptidyl-prolyl cis-trans isomerase [Thiobacillaceae bacterium]HNU65463.1 FKBP-type peptidyl-prolyl cis-trans isomerase [Thiobacillaceae bacterium]
MSDDIIGHGKVVYITYSVLDEHGNIFGQQDMPTGYVQGADSGLFAAVERALEGKREGDSIKVTVPPEEGFGDPDPALIIQEGLDNLPPMLRSVGAQAEMQNDAGDILTFRVVDIRDGMATLDGNNPLAGRPCVVAATVVSVRPATLEEMRTGFPSASAPPTLH